MPTPPLATPTADSHKQCVECGSTLILTGKPVTFTDTKGTAPSARMRGHNPYKGWVPSLLVTICPICDMPASVMTAEPKQAVAAESYLERVAREHDEKPA